MSTLPEVVLPFAQLQIMVVEARDFISTTTAQLPDLYCKISHTGSRHSISMQTNVCKETRHPKWYEEFVLVLDDLSDVKLTIKESRTTISKNYGEVILDMSSIKVNTRVEEWFTLSPPLEDQSFDETATIGSGKVKLVYLVTPLESLPTNYPKLTRKLPPFRLHVNKSEVVSGGLIEGTVTLLTPTTVELNRLNLRISGTESVSWDWDTDRYFAASSTVLNKWYHGWQNSQKTIDAGCYNWKFRVKVPTGLPPTFESAYGKIQYELQAYMDHVKFTEAIPLKVSSPSIVSICPEGTQNKHNIKVHCSLEKPLYHIEDGPIRVFIPTSIKNYSDHRIKSVKVTVTEHSTFSANNNITSHQKLLFKQHYRSIQIGGHQKWEGKLMAILPVDYRTPTIPKTVDGTSRIACTHLVKVVVTKDRPIMDNKVCLDLNMTITSKGDGLPIEKEEKKQYISLMKDLMITTPPSPLVDTKPRDLVKEEDKETDLLEEPWLGTGKVSNVIVKDLHALDFSNIRIETAPVLYPTLHNPLPPFAPVGYTSPYGLSINIPPSQPNTNPFGIPYGGCGGAFGVSADLTPRNQSSPTVVPPNPFCTTEEQAQRHLPQPAYPSQHQQYLPQCAYPPQHPFTSRQLPSQDPHTVTTQLLS